ncbi:hypothetical protein C5167_035055 [Papaver somniferum]|uniref:Cytochrome P450 n=1 Tax=Papaver somniferum TaxID=3469 RepID=A0A4Y7KIX4_PAPSO|nr:hypothetical protein C5167_035055 [Papaver somniferum]
MGDHLLRICMGILLVLVFFLSFYGLKIIITNKKKHDKGVQPPGTTGWPIIGETLEFIQTSLKGVPEKFFHDRVRKYSSKVFKSSLLGVPITVLSGAAGNKFMFSNEYKLVKVWWPPSIRKIIPTSEDAFLPSAPRQSKNLRNKVYPLILKPAILRKYVGVMDSMAIKHFDTHWDNKEEMHNFSLACWLFLSIDDQARVDELLKPFNLVMGGILSIPIDLPGTPLNRAIKASKVIRKEFTRIIEQRMEQMQLFKENKEKMENNSTSSTPILQPPIKDMLSQMILSSDEINYHEGDHGTCADTNNNSDTKKTKKFMNATYIADMILSMIVASYHTPSAVVTVLMKYLVELPDVLDKVLSEQNKIANSKAPGELLNLGDIHKMKYSWNVLCEVLRLAPPLQGAFTQALTDFTYAGYFIPKGWKLYWSATSTHKNPEYFPDPDKFDPSRFQGKGPAPYTFVAFGGGPGMCPGREYSRIQMLIFMHHVVRRYRWEKLLPGDEKIKVNPFPLPAKGLPIRLQPRTT